MKRLAVLAGISLVLAACSGGRSVPKTDNTGLGVGSASPGGSYSADAFKCPTSDSTADVARAAAPAVARRTVRTRSITPQPSSDLLAVTYEAQSLANDRERATLREQGAGATFVREYDFAHTGLVTRVVQPTSGSLSVVAERMRRLPGVRSVSQTGFHRHIDAVTTPYVTDDPYFQGFGASPPLYETSTSEGQWDMHVTRLEYAFGYSRQGNGSNVVNTSATGSTNVKIAIVDTGEDTTHPDLSAKIVYQRCFLTNPAEVQSTSKFETDPQGHGTAVSGLAAASPDNGFGFVGSGGFSSIYAYRIFPTPDDSCVGDSADVQCFTNSEDVASAIEDAVAQKVSVINLSFGDSSCSTAGVDDDSLEGNAVADAIAANIIVVAAAGDSGASSLESPACDDGVIAVGATGLSDGIANGSGNGSGSNANPREYVASYSNYGSPGAMAGNANAWGIVAPGGDPGSSSDQDDLHYIENLWTSTPFDSNYAGTCTTDDLSADEAIDCHAFTIGTSISAPIVAGAAALIVSVTGNYDSPAKMKQLLCQTADDIGAKNEGCGRLDIDRAMAVALHDQTEPGPQPSP